jgi:hypothetical protein
MNQRGHESAHDRDGLLHVVTQKRLTPPRAQKRNRSYAGHSDRQTYMDWNMDRALRKWRDTGNFSLNDMDAKIATTDMFDSMDVCDRLARNYLASFCLAPDLVWWI